MNMRTGSDRGPRLRFNTQAEDDWVSSDAVQGGFDHSSTRYLAHIVTFSDELKMLLRTMA